MNEEKGLLIIRFYKSAICLFVWQCLSPHLKTRLSFSLRFRVYRHEYSPHEASNFLLLNRQTATKFNNVGRPFDIWCPALTCHRCYRLLFNPISRHRSLVSCKLPCPNIFIINLINFLNCENPIRFHKHGKNRYWLLALSDELGFPYRPVHILEMS